MLFDSADANGHDLIAVAIALNAAGSYEHVVRTVAHMRPQEGTVSLLVEAPPDATASDRVVVSYPGDMPGNRAVADFLHDIRHRMTSPECIIVQVADDPALGSAMRHQLQQQNVAVLWLAPLCMADRRVGLLAFGHATLDHFTEDIRRVLEALTTLAAAAVERIRAQREIERVRQEKQAAREELQVLLQVSQSMNAANTFRQIIEAVAQVDMGGGDWYLNVFENFDHRRATYIETVATIKGEFMAEGKRISLDELPFLKQNPRPGVWAYEDVQHHPELDEVTRSAMVSRGIMSNLRVGLHRHGRILGTFGIDHDHPRRYSARDMRLMTVLGELVSAAVERIRFQQEAYQGRQKAERFAEQVQRIAVLEERNRLSRELHDSVSQALYGIGLGARTAKHYLDIDPAQVREPLNYVLSLAEAGLAEMRALIFDLRMEGLAAEGLIGALERQVQSIQSRHGLQVNARFSGEPDVPLAIKEEIYRILREALHNTVKHARATQITIDFSGSVDQLHVVIRDNGVGFNVNDPFTGHLGLRSMRERAQKLGGSLDIRSMSDHGTTITLIVPMNGREAERGE